MSPMLDDTTLKAMRSTPPRLCDECQVWVVKNYCRSCDEFFEAGHQCPDLGLKHIGHRTY